MKKKLLWISGGIVIALVLLLFAGYQYLFNNLDPEEKAALQQQMDQITKAVLEEVDSAKAGESDVLSGAAVGAGAGEDSGSEQGTNKPTGSQRGKGKTAEEQRISDIYYNAGLSLQSKGYGVVDGLLSGAKADYAALKAQGAGKTELAKLGSSYTNRAKAMEDAMDSSVEALLSKMKTDLIAAGCSSEEAQAQYDAYLGEYKSVKEAKRSDILAKAKAMM